VIAGIGTVALLVHKQPGEKPIKPRIGAIRPVNAADGYIENARPATGLVNVSRGA